MASFDYEKSRFVDRIRVIAFREAWDAGVTFIDWNNVHLDLEWFPIPIVGDERDRTIQFSGHPSTIDESQPRVPRLAESHDADAVNESRLLAIKRSHACGKCGTIRTAIKLSLEL